MLDFSASSKESNYLQNCLFPQKPDSKMDWPIFHSETNIKLSKKEQKKNFNKTTYYSDWQWPDKTINFITDIHADANAFISSLILSGAIKKTGIKSTDFILSKKCKNTRIIIGGDCLDKGPSNLSLLRTLDKFLQLKKDTVLLAGNHDIRLYMGLKCLLQKENIASSHFFIRMGKKVLPLLKEVYDEFIDNTEAENHSLSLDFCRQKLFPGNNWQAEFIQINKEQLSQEVIELELKKINKKWKNFESDCQEFGLDLLMVYQAAIKCQHLFLKPDGEFYWFFTKMKLVHQEESFLFLHAGLDNKITKVVKKSGIKHLNILYKKFLNQDLCQFYYGMVANLIRTKYRKTDPIFNNKGVLRLHRLGIHAIVHGHVSQTSGQNIKLRSGMLHFECDVTINRNSRLKSGLGDFGAGVTIINPKGTIQGISTDCLQIKLFQPE